MCGTLILPVIGTSSLVLDGKKYGSYLFCLSLFVFFGFLAYSVLALIREKMIRINELEELLVPKLSIIFEEKKPYLENTKDVGLPECKIIRVGVKNNNLVEASKVRVKIESCIPPGTKAILLKQDLMPTGIVGDVTIGPRQEQLFDIVVTQIGTNDSRIAYNMNGPDAIIDRQDYELEISASCAESVPAKDTFRIEIGPDGFFVMRRMLDQFSDSSELGQRRV